MIMQLKYNEDSRRIELGDTEFHAGDRLKVLVIQDGKPVWVVTSIEYSHQHKEWYLVGFRSLSLPGLFATLD